jgi:hypothetical protein
MTKNCFVLIVLSFVLLVSMAGCGVTQASPTNTPVLTNTTVPTNTVIPTLTLIPPTPIPEGPGIEEKCTGGIPQGFSSMRCFSIMKDPNVTGFLYYQSNKIVAIAGVYYLTAVNDDVNAALHNFIWGWANNAGWNMADLNGFDISSMNQMYTSGGLEGTVDVDTQTNVITYYALAGTTNALLTAGIDNPIAFQGGSFQIYNQVYLGTDGYSDDIANYSSDNPGSVNFTDDGTSSMQGIPGKSILIVYFQYSGVDVGSLFSGTFRQPHKFYITDNVDGVTQPAADWYYISYSNEAIIAFYVTSNAGPYILHDDVDGWTIDLTKLLKQE